MTTHDVSTVPVTLPGAKRRKVPSRALTNGTVTGGGIGVLVDIALWAFGVPVPPGAGAAIGSLITAGVAYATRGGRKGEPQ